MYFFNAVFNLQVLIIGGSTGTMLEALEVVGDSHDVSSELVCLSLDCIFFFYIQVPCLLKIVKLHYSGKQQS